jgi:regulator of replication initiation timing
MTDPFHQESDRVKYWRSRYEKEFERAKSYEMDLVHANYEVNKLRSRVVELFEQNRTLDMQMQTILKELNDADKSEC